MPKKTQIAVRLPNADMLAKIDARADAGGYSRNAWIIKALEWVLDQPVTSRTKREQV